MYRCAYNIAYIRFVVRTLIKKYLLKRNTLRMFFFSILLRWKL